MKRVFWILSLIIAMNLVGTAQNQKKSPETLDGPGNQAAKQGRDAKNTNKSKPDSKQDKNTIPALSLMTNIEAQLQSALDVRSAHVGDQVILKTTKSIKQNGEIVVSKGATLIGRVTEVGQKTKGGTPSRIGLVFDRLEGRDIAMPITASIVSVADVRAASTVSDVFISDVSGSSSSSTRASSGSSSGGGLLGGVTNTVGGVTNTATQTVGKVAGTTTGTLGGATQTVGKTLGGIQISQSASGSAQGTTTLSSQNKNLRLEKGVLFQLQVQKTGGN